MFYFCIHILFFIALFSDSHNTDGAHQITHRILFTLCKICHQVMSQSFPTGSVLIDWQLEKTRTTRSDSNTFICTLGNLSKMIILYYTIILLWKFSSWTVKSVKNDKLEVLNEAAAIVPNSSSKCKCTQLLFWGSLSRYIKAEVCNKLRRSSWKLQWQT